MVSSLCCWLYLVIVGFNDSRCLFQTICWARQPAFRELDSGLCSSNFHVFFVSSARGKTRHVRFSGNVQLRLELLGPTVHLPGGLRAQPWNRLQSVWNGVVGRKLGRGTPCYGHLVSSSVFDHMFQSSNLESKFQTKPKSHISWPEMDIHGKHH